MPVPDKSPGLIPEGDDVIQLLEVRNIPADTEEEWARKGFSGSPKTQWMWRFRSQSVDPLSGQAYEPVLYTGTKYGDARASLTRLYKMLLPGISEAQRSEYNSDLLLQAWFDVTWSHDKTTKGSIKLGYLAIRPYRAPAAAPEPAQAPAAAAASAAPAPAPASTTVPPESGANPFTATPAAAAPAAAAAANPMDAE